MTRRRARLAGLALLALTPTFLAAQPQPQPRIPDGSSAAPRQRRPQSPPRDPSAVPEVGTGRIKGRVIDAEGRPVRRATVMTFGRDSRPPRSATTDADGSYELTELPAGTYQLSASKGGYVRLMYGQRTAMGTGRPLELATGQALDKIDFSLPRGGVIVGRVVDEFGDPVTEAIVTPLRYMTAGTRKRLMNAHRTAQTDDLGHYRLYGLTPGEYYVSAQVRSERFGGPSPAAPPSGDSTGYPPTFSPSTPSAAEAARITVLPGQESTADVQLVASRLMRVAGVVVSASGGPASNGFVTLASKGEMVATGSTMGAPIGPGGAFTIGEVPPGSYTLVARASGEGSFGFSGRRRGGDDDAEFAMVPVVVAEDVTGMRVVTGKGLKVPGVLVAEGGALPTGSPIRIIPIAADPDMMTMSSRPAEVLPDGRFELEGVVGEGSVQPMGLPRGWMLKSVSYKGEDVTDKPIEFASDAGPIRMVITNRITVLTGAVSATNGAPLGDYEVLVFPEDSSRWGTMGRALRVTRPDQQGVYKVEGLPPGSYHVVAFDRIEGEQRTSTEFLEQAKASAESVTLAEGQTRTLMLKLSTAPQ